jgi:predicted neutral ceramidase superfamily lipid hydrolase
MLDFNTLFEFSRANCAGICAFLIPANILATLLTIILTVLNRPTLQIWQAAGFASMFAAIMILHVYTWFIIGVVMLPTYILLGLAVTCLFANLAAILWRSNSLKWNYRQAKTGI